MTPCSCGGYHPRRKEARLSPLQERLALALVLATGFGLRTVRADQPIVENYVGRQIPTAMVARNLDRGSGFLWPELDTGPFPNFFLVEPPLYELFVVACKRQTGLPLEVSGRVVSALATALGGWGLYGLARRREGLGVALMATAAFLFFPVTIRYGRAFQPDALMLGTVLAGLRCWDVFAATRDGRWLAAGWLLLATGLATKVTAAHVLIPLLLVIDRPARWWTAGLAVLALVPAALWYAHALSLMRQGLGTGSVENAATWGRALVPTAWLRPMTYGNLGRFLVWRAFTPLGFALGCAGLAWPAGADRLWRVWAAAAAATLVILAAKLHHEYYFLALAPVVAVGLARSLRGLARVGNHGWLLAGAAAAATLVLAAGLSASTWRTPAEWARLGEAADLLRGRTSRVRFLVAPEALLYMADRRGYRLEYTAEAATRAEREWQGPAPSHVEPIDLVAFYASRGGWAVADVQPELLDPNRRALHQALRSRYPQPAVDRPGVLLLVPLTQPRAAADRSHRFRGAP